VLRARLRTALRNLTGGVERQLVEHLLDQLAATREAGVLVRRLVRGGTDSARAREEIRDIEHRGDRSRADLVEELSRSLTTPIDREDLFRLSRSIDDVLDNLRDFVRELDLFAVQATRAHLEVVDAVISGVEELERSVRNLPSDAGQAARDALSAKKEANQVRRRYQEGLAELLGGVIDSEALKRRELLRRLDVVGLRLGEAADALADGATKRGH
jgi:uncharacterized protein